MTTPDDFFTLAIPLRSGSQNQSMIIPESQRNTGDDAFRLELPAGFHTIQLMWQHSATPVHVRLWDGSTNGRNLAILPGGADAKPVTVTVTVPPEGYGLTFLQQFPVTSDLVGTPQNTLGVNFILNPARTREA